MRKICLRCGSKFGSRAEYCPHDGSMLATDDDIPDPLLGSVLLEQFRVEEQIGVGGMGTVYRAHQTTIGRDVAIKVLRAELARDEQAVARFEREARLCTSLDHPNLVRVFLSGRLSDGRLYIVMELLKGRSLADELDEHGPPSLERVVIMIMKLCAGLGAVHAAGIVHRDIKPENVYLVQRGRDSDFVKLVDFGVARVLEADGTPTTTQSGRVFGTATYISPEAATGEETDHRSDIYSLGVLSYQLLTGELPFEGSTAAAVLMQHVHSEPPAFESKGRGAEVPAEVAEVVMRSLSKDPAARQQTLEEFLDTLAEAAGNAGLLQDARTLLLGTVWGENLAAPGSYLAELLAASSPSSFPPALDDTQPVTVERDPEEEALLSSAPKPFGTTSYDLAPAARPNKRSHSWLWAALGLLAIVLIGFVAGAWFRQQVPQATAVEPESVEPPPVAVDEEEPLADVGTDVPVVEPEPVAIEEPVVEEEEPPPPPKPKPKKKKKKRTKPKPAPSRKETASQPPRDSGESPVATESLYGGLEPDEGIDWTVPDFPEEQPPTEPAAPIEPSPPTGTPDAPARNPLVIDEPPQ
ncbi:MAG: serine/threonine protein kinase [Myxococcales bacterium]|nr:MAG: serine/threonine protein kinase [Myxococcales bacterium]